jgi:hypothetical protein
VRRLTPLILIVALTVLAGCGSSSGDSTSATETTTSGDGALTRAEFITRADALCAASKAKQAPLRSKVEAAARRARKEEARSGGNVSDDTRAELAEALRGIVAMAEAGLSRVQELGAPDADADQLEAIYQQTESAFQSSRGYGAALEEHEDARAQKLAEAGNAKTRETATLARRYGFRVCGSQP